VRVRVRSHSGAKMHPATTTRVKKGYNGLERGHGFKQGLEGLKRG
jgi:hypothetical protein